MHGLEAPLARSESASITMYEEMGEIEMYPTLVSLPSQVRIEGCDRVNDQQHPRMSSLSHLPFFVRTLTSIIGSSQVLRIKEGRLNVGNDLNESRGVEGGNELEAIEDGSNVLQKSTREGDETGER
jgi:hypothetical protein